MVVADGLGRSLNIHKVLSKSLLKCYKFLLEFTGIVVVRKFDHCKIFPSVSGILTTNNVAHLSVM